MVRAIRPGARRPWGTSHPTFSELQTQHPAPLGTQLAAPHARAKKSTSRNDQPRLRPWDPKSNTHLGPQESRKVLSKTPLFIRPRDVGPLNGKRQPLFVQYLSKSNSIPRRFKRFDLDAKWVNLQKTCIWLAQAALSKSLCSSGLSFPICKASCSLSCRDEMPSGKSEELHDFKTPGPSGIGRMEMWQELSLESGCLTSVLLPHLPSVWPWASCLSSRCLHFCSYKMVLITVSTS